MTNFRRSNIELLIKAMQFCKPADRHGSGVVEAINGGELLQWRFTCRVLAVHLAAENKAFDSKKFLVDCGVDDM